jgi:peptidoglycan hydrolase-like protein with peptidoglycan-binding domain
MCKPDRNVITDVLSSTITLFLTMMLILASAAPALGQQFVSVPVGTVIPLRIDKLLSSNSSRVGDAFSATVFRPLLVDGRTILPEGAKVEGRVTGITQGVPGKSPATIAVAFDKISLPDGKAIPVDATLTALDEEARRRIEQDVRSQSGQNRRAVVFVGASGGANATIGVPSAPAKSNSVGAIIGSVLGGGNRADVQASTEFGMMVESAFNVETTPVATNRDSAPQSQSVLSSYDSIRAAQTALRDQNYYHGPINGVMNQATRDAIRNFQRDRNISNTGELDLSTARTLGIPVDVGTGGSGTGGSGTGIGDPRQIAFLADRLLQDFQRELNIRNNRGQVIFDKQRNFKPYEVEVLSQMMSLRGSADLYSQLTASFTDRDTVKGAAVGLIRQARLLDRIIRRSQIPLSSLVSSDLQQLQSELARISIIDPNDSDIVR